MAELSPFFTYCRRGLRPIIFMILALGAWHCVRPIASIAAVDPGPLPGRDRPGTISPMPAFVVSGGALRIPHSEFTPERLASETLGACRRSGKTVGRWRNAAGMPSFSTPPERLPVC